MTTTQKLEERARKHINIKSDVYGVVDNLRRYFEDDENIETGSVYHCDLAELMTRMGLVKKTNPDEIGYHDYIPTKEARKLYNQLVEERSNLLD